LLAGACTSHATDYQSGPRTDAGSLTPADGGTRDRTNDGADNCTTHTGIDLAVTPYKALGVLATLGIVTAKLFKGLSCSGQGHHAWASRHRSTSGEQQHGKHNG
jgi:hypothetical protein